MSFDVLDEHEQGELVQTWLRENALSIVVGIGLGLLLIFGWQQWRKHQASHRLDAATQYEVFAADLTAKDIDGARQIAAKLQSDFADTPYATLSAMRMAEHDATQRNHAGAHKELESAYEHAGIPPLKTLSGLYLARSEIVQKHPQEALKMLDTLPPEGYGGLRAELRGDALVALGRKADARVAYAKALNELAGDDSASNATTRAFLQMKLNDLSAAENKGS